MGVYSILFSSVLRGVDGSVFQNNSLSLHREQESIGQYFFHENRNLKNAANHGSTYVKILETLSKRGSEVPGDSR